MSAEIVPLKPRPDTHVLTFRDEEIVVWWRRGASAAEIARTLGHTVELVQTVIHLAEALGVDTRRRPPTQP